MFTESTKATGRVHIRLFDADGKLKLERLGPNLVVTTGKNYLATWLAQPSQAGPFMGYVEVGTDDTVTGLSDTTLGAPVDRVAGVLGDALNVWSNTATFGPGVGTGTLTEAGLFSESSGGTMFARQVFAPIPKLSGDTLEFSWEVTFS